MTIVKLPTVLAFDRKLEPSDGVMFSGSWKDIDNSKEWQPIQLFDRRNRAVKSNFKPEVLNNEEELQKQIKEANLSWGDDASLKYGHDTLCLSFSLRVVPDISKPTICNDIDFEKVFTKTISENLSDTLEELAHRYAYNIANGRFLWRNRVGAQQIKVCVSGEGFNETLEFNAYDFSLDKTKIENSNVIKLTNVILAGLKGDKSVVFKVEAFSQLGDAQRIWPSQEMILKSVKGEKSRHLFSLNDVNGFDNVAAMHCEKIGNALRTVDDWYSNDEDVKPIAVEAYGTVTQRGIAYRSSRNDFKTLLLRWLDEENSSQLTVDEKCFVVAMLIRGGVFGESES